MDNYEEIKEIQPLEVMPPSAIMQMEKAQIDVQVATAHQYPRTIEKFKARSIAMATMDEETAESCVYCRPVGKEKDERGVWKEKYAEGASIRLAEIVAASYGNIRVAARIIEQTDRFVRAEGVAHDLESNYAGKSECIESTVTKDGKPYSERQRALTAKVCLAKAYRDACFKVVPRAMCKPAYEAAKKVAAAADKPIEERRKKAMAWVSSLKIDEARVFAVLEVKGWKETTGDHLLRLTGLRTSIADGDESIDSVFPPVSGEGSSKAKAPVATAHQQATKAPEKPKDEAKEAKTPATPPTEPKPQDGQTPSNVVPLQGQSDEAAEAAAGLAPQQPTPPEQPPTPETTTPQKDPAPIEGDPGLEPQQGDSPSILSIKGKLKAAGIPWEQFKKFLQEKKLLKEGQKDMREILSTRVDAIDRNVAGWFAEIRAVKV